MVKVSYAWLQMVLAVSWNLDMCRNQIKPTKDLGTRQVSSSSYLLGEKNYLVFIIVGT